MFFMPTTAFFYIAIDFALSAFKVAQRGLAYEGSNLQAMDVWGREGSRHCCSVGKIRKLGEAPE